MKVLILSDSFPPRDLSGASVVAYNHARELFNAGIKVCVITTSSKRTDENKQLFQGLSLYTIYSNYKSLWRGYKSLCNKQTVRKIEKIISEENPDIVHAHNIHYSLSYASLKIARHHAKKVFLTVHDSMPFHYGKLHPQTINATDGNVKSYKISPWEQLRLFKFAYNPFRNMLIRSYMKVPDKVFSVSNALKKALTDNGINNVETVHNGIDLNQWATESDRLETFEVGHGLKGKKVLFFGGRLSRAKGGDQLLKSFSELSKTYSDLVLLIVGEKDSYAANLIDQAEKLELKDKLIFTGRLQREDMKYAYASSSVVIVPSIIFDWFPTIILETMASGRAVIGSVFGGAKELIDDGKNGYLVNPLNGDELTQRIKDLISNPGKAEEFGKRGLEKVRSEFSQQKFMNKLLGYYNAQ